MVLPLGSEQILVHKQAVEKDVNCPHRILQTKLYMCLLHKRSVTYGILKLTFSFNAFGSTGRLLRSIKNVATSVISRNT